MRGPVKRLIPKTRGKSKGDRPGLIDHVEILKRSAHDRRFKVTAVELAVQTKARQDAFSRSRLLILAPGLPQGQMLFGADTARAHI